MRLPPDCASVRPAVGPTPEDARGRVPANDLRSAEDRPRVASDELLHVMTLCPEGGEDLLRDAVLDGDLRGQCVRPDAEARRVDCPLRLHAEVDHVEQELHVALRLHEPPHVGQARVQRPLGVENHARDDGVERPLPPRERVGVPRAEAEAVPPVLEGEAAPFGHEARPEAHVVGVHRAHGVAHGVHHLKAHRVARRQGAPARHVRPRPRRVEVGPPPGRVALGEQRLDGHLRGVRVGDEPPRVGEGGPHRLE
mmetsp:Transcript_46064/g.104067  ORF Transcript_46064/g.104067 Transcript_46064/m.104067 type:complete len:253 (-) Transcript_46064:647-1405(-)